MRVTRAAGAPRLREIKDAASLDFLKALGKGIGDHHLPAFAAGLAYGAVFAVLPILALLVLLLGLFNAVDLVSNAMDELRAVLPVEMTRLINERLTAIATDNDDAKFGAGVVVSTLVALWGASGAMKRIMEALNVVHNATETRSFARKLLTSVLLAIGAIAVLAFSLLVVVVGGTATSRIFDVIGLGETAESIWNILRWPSLLALVWASLAGLYRFAPAARQAGGVFTPGTLFATVSWVVFSALFSWYVGSIGDMSATWGSVAGIVVFLLYLQYAGLLVLIGALIDVLLWDRNRPSSKLQRLVGSSTK